MNLTGFRLNFSRLMLLVAAFLAENFLSENRLIAAQADKPGKQIADVFQTQDGTKVDYLIYHPQDYKKDGEQKFPLMIFLHGRGESHGGIEAVAKWGPPQMVARGEELPFIIVSPQCPAGDFWSSEKQIGIVAELIDGIVSSHSVDAQRIYLTGLSMGGFGSWALAAKSPEKFAAVVPICGAGDAKKAERLKELPIWVFHGDQDTVIPIKHSNEMVEAIKAAGGSKIRYTTLEHVGHNSWSAAYASPEVYEWMLRHTNQQPAKSDPS